MPSEALRSEDKLGIRWSDLRHTKAALTSTASCNGQKGATSHEVKTSSTLFPASTTSQRYAEHRPVARQDRVVLGPVLKPLSDRDKLDAATRYTAARNRTKYIG
jgi:hypothetical protein